VRGRPDRKSDGLEIVPKRIKTGRAASRALLIIYARTAIEQAIKVKRRPKPTMQ